MIHDVPSENDFRDVGLSLLNMAWDVGAALLRDLDEADVLGVDVREVEAEYWAAARQQLASSQATALQAAEFLLKGKIAAVSAFLLLSAAPREWPKGCERQDTPFGEFRMIDAQDLVRVHDSCCATRLAPEFVAALDTLRRQRNAIMHTIDRRVQVHVRDLLLSILLVHHHLCQNEDWGTVRRAYLKSTPISALHSADHVEGLVIWEFTLLIDLLAPAELMKFFGFNKRQRRYICPECRKRSGDMELSPQTAVLRPNRPDSTTVWCFICQQEQTVERRDCPEPNCHGNVVSTEYEICLTCEHDPA
jgi:hypothetical protein